MFRVGQRSDDQIIRSVLAGRRDDFSVLVERYLPTVYAFAAANSNVFSVLIAFISILTCWFVTI